MSRPLRRPVKRQRTNSANEAEVATLIEGEGSLQTAALTDSMADFFAAVVRIYKGVLPTVDVSATFSAATR